ncbi:MAG: hypothetical protein GEU95_27175 [Rhizobiales bacterium]|nr:hypothetical protein [Hyphomicrobiales bacterium]
MLRLASLAAAIVVTASPAPAQFYKDKTLTMLVNYAAGGNADTEARVFQRHLSKHIAGKPNIIIRNLPGAGGANAMNQLGLGIAGKPDGLTLGFFTMSATSSITDDPVLKVKIPDVYVPIAGGRGWNVVYGRKDIVPGGYTRPADFPKAKRIFAGGYGKATSHDTRLRLVLDVMNLPYTMVTGFQGAGHVNQAMLKGEVNFTGSSLPGFQTQVIPQIIKEGVGVALFHHPVMAEDGSPQGNPLLEKQGIITFHQFYREAFGKPPSGAKHDALFLMNDISTKMQRGMLVPKGSPPEAITELRKAFAALQHDPAFAKEFRAITGEEPDIVSPAEMEQILNRIRNVSPEVKKVLRASVGQEG